MEKKEKFIPNVSKGKKRRDSGAAAGSSNPPSFEAFGKHGREFQNGAGARRLTGKAGRWAIRKRRED